MPANVSVVQEDFEERRIISPEPLTLYEGYDGIHGERDACGIGAIVNRLGEANRTAGRSSLSQADRI